MNEVRKGKFKGTTREARDPETIKKRMVRRKQAARVGLRGPRGPGAIKLSSASLRSLTRHNYLRRNSGTHRVCFVAGPLDPLDPLNTSNKKTTCLQYPRVPVARAI